MPILDRQIYDGYADISKAKKNLGYNPKFPIEEVLARLVNWYVKNVHLLTNVAQEADKSLSSKHR